METIEMALDIVGNPEPYSYVGGAALEATKELMINVCEKGVCAWRIAAEYYAEIGGK